MYGRAKLLAAAVDAGSGLIDVPCVASSTMHGLHVSHQQCYMLGLATEADLASLTSICGAVSSSIYEFLYIGVFIPRDFPM